MFVCRVHKLILSARSPVFKAMLTSDMIERTQGVINIEVDRAMSDLCTVECSIVTVHCVHRAVQCSEVQWLYALCCFVLWRPCLQDASVEVVRQMVRYMYTAKVEHDFDRIKELLVLANKYQVKWQRGHLTNKLNL